VFAFPWEGATLVGTTDLDHDEADGHEARITRAELDYLMAALRAQFPQLGTRRSDVLSTYAGVRPVIAGGQGGAPRGGARARVWSEDGLVAVAGGKLTTFRAIALDALRLVRAGSCPAGATALRACRVFAPVPRPRAGAACPPAC
jgi:glycerol-3-phosphate dehydrogenase